MTRRMVTFNYGKSRFAVNPDRVAFVRTDPEGKVEIHFSGQDGDYIMVDDDGFDEVWQRTLDA